MPESVAELLKERLGVSTTELYNRELSTVGTSVVRILRQTPHRVAFTIINLSVNLLYVGPFGDVSATKGIQIGPSGGNLALDIIEDFTLPAQEWFAVATGASSAVTILELLLQRQPAA